MVLSERTHHDFTSASYSVTLKPETSADWLLEGHHPCKPAGSVENHLGFLSSPSVKFRSWTTPSPRTHSITTLDFTYVFKFFALRSDKVVEKNEWPLDILAGLHPEELIAKEARKRSSKKRDEDIRSRVIFCSYLLS